VALGVSPAGEIKLGEHVVDRLEVLGVELDVGRLDVLARALGVGRAGDGDDL